MLMFSFQLTAVNIRAFFSLIYQISLIYGTWAFIYSFFDSSLVKQDAAHMEPKLHRYTEKLSFFGRKKDKIKDVFSLCYR